MSILAITKFAPSTLEHAFLTSTTVNYEKVEKCRISGIHEEGIFLNFFMFVFSISMAFRKFNVGEVVWRFIIVKSKYCSIYSELTKRS